MTGEWDGLPDQDVLSAVLEELERERQKRAQLEMEVAMLWKKLDEYAVSQVIDDEKVSRRDLVAMQTERDGYCEIIDALTTENKAIAASKTAKETRIPLHVVRLLEIVPWDTQAQQHAIATEEVYEWQVYKKGKGWCRRIRYFPNDFRNLEVVQPKPGFAMEEETHSIRLFRESPPTQCVLTNEQMTKIINIDNGYPLPQDEGEWKWIGGWLVEKRVTVANRSPRSLKNTVDCDEDGWSYAEALDHFVSDPAELCWDSPSVQDDETLLRPYRRRKWTRQRALLSYPHASERTTRYLKLLADNALLTISSSRLRSQLVETKTKLIEMEENFLNTKASLHRENELLSASLAEREAALFQTIQKNHKDTESNSSPEGEEGREHGFTKFRNLVDSLVHSKQQSADRTVSTVCDDTDSNGSSSALGTSPPASDRKNSTILGLFLSKRRGTADRQEADTTAPASAPLEDTTSGGDNDDDDEPSTEVEDVLQNHPHDAEFGDIGTTSFSQDSDASPVDNNDVCAATVLVSRNHETAISV